MIIENQTVKGEMMYIKMFCPKGAKQPIFEYDITMVIKLSYAGQTNIISTTNQKFGA